MSVCLPFCISEVGRTGLQWRLNNYQFPSIFLLVSFLFTWLSWAVYSAWHYRETAPLQQQSARPLLFALLLLAIWVKEHKGRRPSGKDVVFPLPLTPLFLCLSGLLFRLILKNLISCLCREHTNALSTGWEALPLAPPSAPPHRARSLQSLVSVPTGSLSWAFWNTLWVLISLPQSPKPASGACLGLFKGVLIEDRQGKPVCTPLDPRSV